MVQELPTLELANDCHRFVAAFFEIIRASSPHIYHSALMLAPKTSIVRKLYESHSHPFVRIVHGASESWDSSTATTTFPFPIGRTAWSPCNRFIAISSWETARADILDSATLQRLQSFGPLEGLAISSALIFSPDNRMLTYSGNKATRSTLHSSSILMTQKVLVVTWDIQTGGVVSAIEWETQDGPGERSHITYSMDGRVVVILSTRYYGAIFDVVTGLHMHDIDFRHLVGSSLCHIWTDGKYIRFAATRQTGISVWEVGIAPGDTPVEVKVLPSLDDVSNRGGSGLLSASDQVAPTNTNPTVVWNSQDSKSLLHHPGLHPNPLITFFCDGCLFTCSTAGSVVYLWKESPAGYILGKIPPPYREPLLSPDCKSIIAFFGPTVQLWHMNNFSTAPFSIYVQLQKTEKFILDFLPDRPLAVVMREKDNTMTVLDLSSGVPWCSIEAPMEVYGLRMNNNTIVAMGSDEIITWNMPEENPLPDVSLNIGDSTQTIHLSGDDESLDRKYATCQVVMSIDLQYIAFIVEDELCLGNLCVYSASTGKYLDGTTTALTGTLWFAPSGDEVWYAYEDRAEVWTITGEKLVHKMVIDNFNHGPQECPWRSSCGYQVTPDGWVLSPGKKPLLMLPPPWQSHRDHRVWSRQFLALLHGTLSEPIVIEVEP